MGRRWWKICRKCWRCRRRLRRPYRMSFGYRREQLMSMRSVKLPERLPRTNDNTIKLITTSQPCTASTTEDTLATAHGTDIRTASLPQAVLIREHHHSASIAGTDTGDALSHEAFEPIRAVGARSIERQGDSRALVLGSLARTVRLLAGVLCFGRDGDIKAGDEVLSGWRIWADSDQAGSED